MELFADGGLRHVDDGVVDQRQEDAQAEDGEDRPPPDPGGVRRLPAAQELGEHDGLLGESGESATPCRYECHGKSSLWQVIKNLTVLKTFAMLGRWRHGGIVADRKRSTTSRPQPAPSRQTLLHALIIDGFASLAAALRGAYEGLRPCPPADQWLGVCQAHRAWALGHPSEYQLLYGHNGEGTVSLGQLPAFHAVVDVLFSIMRGAVAAEEVDTERIEANTPASLRTQLATWRESDDGLSELPDGALAACLISYAQLHGAITLELLAHVPPPLSDRGALFDLEMVHA